LLALAHCGEGGIDNAVDGDLVAGVEVTRKGTTKQTMLARYAELCGIRQEEVMAVGDHLNDLEMVAWAGTGVAVGNAVPGLKEAADYVTVRERSYGVEEAVKHFCL